MLDLVYFVFLSSHFLPPTCPTSSYSGDECNTNYQLFSLSVNYVIPSVQTRLVPSLEKFWDEDGQMKLIAIREGVKLRIWMLLLFIVENYFTQIFELSIFLTIHNLAKVFWKIDVNASAESLVSWCLVGGSRNYVIFRTEFLTL